jgi:hypothetical protein
MGADLACVTQFGPVRFFIAMRLYPTVVAIYSLVILAHAVDHVVWSANQVGFGDVSVGGYTLHLVALAPAVGYFLGLRWCRYLLGGVAALLGLLLLLAPLALHEVERTPTFYAYWSVALIAFVVTAITSFYREAPRDVVV